MRLLIDGYNVLLTVGLVPEKVNPNTLMRGRSILINRVARFLKTLPDEKVREATIVFDSSVKSPKLPRQFEQNGVTVIFAVDFDTADELIIELIKKSPVAKQLTVVSSDWQIKTAANRRKATSINSDDWYEQLLDALSKSKRPKTLPHKNKKADSSNKPVNVEKWMEFFELDEEDELDELLNETNQPAADQIVEDQPKEKETPKLSLTEEELDELKNPFPPGYGQDLLDEI